MALPGRTTCTTVVITLLVVLLLSACSRITLGYRNLHLIVPWTLRDYVSLSGDQQRELRARLREQRAWHCQTLMPEHLEWLDRLQTERFDEASLRQRYQEGQAAVDRIAVQVTPPIIDLLRSLSDRQVRDIRQALGERQQERAEKYLQPSLERQLEERAERMTERATDWFGSLGNAQRQRIEEWAQSLGDSNMRWVANRARWEEALIATLAQRHADDFPARMTTLIQDRQAFWTDEYRRSQPRNEQAGLRLAVDLYALADERQRRHLINEIRTLRNDLTGLDCLD
ncbi:DUF6279 family lipoprotein [Stutzerimonas tarimensis]|uniref:DUF6279 family lipoprotein n=1 Tax=Stutzerimonas tarimensis TaxID=1507735 RepID=A0ABV7T7J6_9GAMM